MMYLVNKPSLSDLRSKLSLQNPTPADASTSHEIAKHNQMIYAMATCHSLRVVDNDLLGDPLDVKMFQFTGWSYQEGGGHVNEQVSNFDTITPSIAKPPISEDPFWDGTQNGSSVSGYMSMEDIRTATNLCPQSAIELGVLRSFEFASDIRRASVIVRQFGDTGASVFVKGAPESVKDICVPGSCESVFPHELVRILISS